MAVHRGDRWSPDDTAAAPQQYCAGGSLAGAIFEPHTGRAHAVGPTPEPHAVEPPTTVQGSIRCKVEVHVQAGQIGGGKEGDLWVRQPLPAGRQLLACELGRQVQGQ